MLSTIESHKLASALMFVTFIVLFYVMFVSTTPPALAQGEEGGSISLVDTSNNIYNELKAPILIIGACSLVVGAFVFMFARGNPEKTRQARMGLAAAIVGFGVATFAVPILNTIKGLIT
jgi:uncharacterized BrkB/YihY/UPF0761 family membrane protein